ncbi:hypothetical protein TSUD_134420 [Trifolium subterraneum]|uniref:Reverse transcriptase zinc-binding domain-containing protein n=1 Tax=Trifolium subterraneum TaxID=3900 RepID=A0A2Z6P4C6_TRISU|nr:hypothetical protein TSUD_134420 [Trifolium subterraneum]
MKIVSLNMRGWGGSAKRRRLSMLLHKGAFDVDGKRAGGTFRKEKWLGMTPLRDLFPSLFNISTQQDGHVSDLGIWTNGNWAWKLEWSVMLDETKAETACELITLLEQVQQRQLTVAAVDYDTEATLKLLWLNNVPSKINIFGWRLLLQKLPTKEALHRKGVITNTHDWACVFCYKEEEDLCHLFFRQALQAIPSHHLVGEYLEYLANP